MLGNFAYCNPTKLYFGDDSLKYLNTELPKYGKNIAEISGVMPNPTLEKLYEGVEIARKHNVDLLLAVGGGSVCDYAKAVSVSVHCDEDPWEKYYLKFEEPTCQIIPVGCVLTMVGTGSEMNAGAVITNHETMLMYGKEASNRKQQIDRQHHIISNQRPKDKHHGNVYNLLFPQCRRLRNPFHSSCQIA